MKNLVKFILLAVIAFAMGAALAWFQGRQGAPSATQEQAAAAQQVIDIQPVAIGDRPRRDNILDGAPAMPDPLDALYGDDADSADTASSDEPQVTPAPEGQKVAGSSVGGAFTMTDHNGADVTEKSWPGKKKLVFFGFTHCPDICPAALDKIGAALGALGGKAEKIQPLFVTTDPKRDTAARLKEYLADYDSRVVGLTGTDAQVDHIKSIYKVYAAIAEGGDVDNYLMDHSGYIYLMSENDELLEIFGSSDTADTIVKKSTPHLN
ncbi:MAG: SCO family protein [Alphaproteobacteria bacterium]